MNKFTVLTLSLFTSGLINAQNQEASDTLSRHLREVIVEAKQPATKLVGSTLVSTIAGSNLEHIGSAIDVLAQLPMMKVEDNNVSVLGKNGLEIYIDGRPMRDNMELQQILSSNLQKVELNLAPGAAYDSTTDAVLTITTRRSFIHGLSLTDQLQLQRRRKWSVMNYIGSTYRTGNWEIFVDGALNDNNSVIKGSTTNSLIYNSKETVIGSSQNNSYPTTTGVIKAGANYTIGAQSLGAYYRFNPECGNFNNSGSEWIDNSPAISRIINKRIRGYNHLASLYYENTFAGQYLLHFDGVLRQSHTKNSVATTYEVTTNPAVNSEDERESTLWAGKFYLKFPLLGGDFTVGMQNSYTHTSLDYRMLNAQVDEYIPSSITAAKQISAALYTSWSRMFNKFLLSAGLRYEFIDYTFNINGLRNNNVSRRDHLLTPDISLSYTFNQETQISLVYKRATVKPPYSQLTGSLTYVGLHEIEGGNPALRDENMHDIQLFGMWNGFMFQADVTRSIDSYAYVKQLYPAHNLQLIMHPININVSALNLYLIWSKNINIWTPNLTAGLYRQWLRLDSKRYEKPIFSYYFDNTFALRRGWSITANISGNSGGDMHTNRFGKTWFTMDASVAKTFLNKSLTVKLSATDIFNSAGNNCTMNTYGIYVDKRQTYDRRGVSLSIIYKLRPRISGYKGGSAADEEMNRL